MCGGCELGQRDLAVGRALDLSEAVDELDVLRRGLHLVGGELTQLFGDLLGGATTARPLLTRVCEPVAPMSHGPASVSW